MDARPTQYQQGEVFCLFISPATGYGAACRLGRLRRSSMICFHVESRGAAFTRRRGERLGAVLQEVQFSGNVDEGSNSVSHESRDRRNNEEANGSPQGRSGAVLICSSSGQQSIWKHGCINCNVRDRHEPLQLNTSNCQHIWATKGDKTRNSCHYALINVSIYLSFGIIKDDECLNWTCGVPMYTTRT